MVITNHNYNFVNNTSVEDKIPTWMDDNFFETLQDLSKKDKQTMEKIAKLFNKDVKDHFCHCCHNKLNSDEVFLCKQCIKSELF